MNKSLFASASYLPRGIFAFAVLALILAAFFDAKFPFEIQAQQLIADDAATASVTENAASRSADQVFLDLAASVGQAAPAKRLVDYRLKADPTNKERYWAIVDFSQPSTNKRLYVFDTVAKTVESYYVAHGRGSEGANNIPAIFSNQNGSNSSSLGIYRTLGE